MSAPKPTERKRRAGNPGKRALPSLSSVAGVQQAPAGSCPDHLGDHGTRLWEAAASYGSGWIAATDLELLRLVCEQVDRRQELVELIASTGPVMTTEKGYVYANPAVGMLSRLEEQIVRNLGALGFTPAERSRLGLAEVKAAKSRLEVLRDQAN